MGETRGKNASRGAPGAGMGEKRGKNASHGAPGAGMGEKRGKNASRVVSGPEEALRRLEKVTPEVRAAVHPSSAGTSRR
ncbi:hypothetical protein J7E73_03260 [Paenibacillus albidus]|uniref:hypothetical protein n=1 Tax=Paenibacillus albidus TaxID=2041023 RepID=UPI001BE76247|nr:hypothetical protein [Paenibacillus albidus]MBT2288164.1 hypothetical protein [Paenibacillus albidus]